VAANATTAVCTITAVANMAPGDRSATAQLSVSAPTLADTYIVAGTPAQVIVKDDGSQAVAGVTPVPSLGVLGLIALSSLLAVFGIARSRRRSA
ncbi:MAG: IPTL-CTERM sorting domain-containing protein, partial [Comamonas sp.]